MEHSLYNNTELIEGPCWGPLNEYQTDILVVIKIKIVSWFYKVYDWLICLMH